MHGGLFSPQVAALKDKVQVITLDLRGHGASRNGGEKATIERLGLDLLEIFEQLDLHGALCVGWSMGGDGRLGGVVSSFLQWTGFRACYDRYEPANH